MYELRVMSGLHRGAALPLVGDHWTVGAADDADLVLFDPGIEPYHLRISLDEQWQIQCLAGRLCDAQGRAHQTMEGLEANTLFSAAGIWCCITPAQTPWPSDAAMDEAERRARRATAAPAPEPGVTPPGPRRARPSLGKRLAVATVILTVATTTWGVANHVQTEVPDLKARERASASLQQPALSLADTRHRLNRMLNARDLDQYVSVTDENNHIALEGEVPVGQEDVVERMLERFQRQHYTDVGIENHVTVFEASLPFRINQIVGGKHPQIVLDNGRRLYPGDQFEGLKLTSIKAGKVSFQGDKQHYEVSW